MTSRELSEWIAFYQLNADAAQVAGLAASAKSGLDQIKQARRASPRRRR